MKRQNQTRIDMNGHLIAVVFYIPIAHDDVIYLDLFMTVKEL